MPSSFLKDPDAVLDFKVDWTNWLAVAETLTSSSWTVPVGLTTASPAPSNTTTAATIWLSGGTVGTTYTVTNHITSSAGRTDDRSITIQIVQR